MVADVPTKCSRATLKIGKSFAHMAICHKLREK